MQISIEKCYTFPHISHSVKFQVNEYDRTIYAKCNSHSSAVQIQVYKEKKILQIIMICIRAFVCVCVCVYVAHMSTDAQSRATLQVWNVLGLYNMPRCCFQFYRNILHNLLLVARAMCVVCVHDACACVRQWRCIGMRHKYTICYIKSLARDSGDRRCEVNRVKTYRCVRRKRAPSKLICVM